MKANFTIESFPLRDAAVGIRHGPGVREPGVLRSLAPTGGTPLNHGIGDPS